MLQWHQRMAYILSLHLSSILFSIFARKHNFNLLLLLCFCCCGGIFLFPFRKKLIKLLKEAVSLVHSTRQECSATANDALWSGKVYLPWKVVKQSGHRKEPSVQCFIFGPILGIQIHKPLCVKRSPTDEEGDYNSGWKYRNLLFVLVS